MELMFTSLVNVNLSHRAITLYMVVLLFANYLAMLRLQSMELQSDSLCLFVCLFVLQSLLQVELDHILTNSSNASLIEENRTLKAHNALMIIENTRLQNDISNTRDKLLDIEEENLKLKTELSRMRSSLSQLLTRPTAGDAPSARVEFVGHSELQTASGNTLSSHETTGTSPSQGFT